MLLRCDQVTLGYENQIAVKNLDFEMEEGDALCVVGENGSGKSTLMKGLLGLLKPVHGRIEYGDAIRNKSIGYLPQQTAAQKDFPATVREVVQSGCLSQCGFRPFYSRKEKKTAEFQMKRLGIDGFAQRSFRDLSGGQQQRVLLARALCATDRLLILDEPTTGLDPAVTREFYDTIEDLNKKEKTAIIMVSHDIQNALRYSTKVLHMETEMLFFGSVEDYKKSDASRMFLGGERS